MSFLFVSFWRAQSIRRSADAWRELFQWQSRAQESRSIWQGFLKWLKTIDLGEERRIPRVSCGECVTVYECRRYRRLGNAVLPGPHHLRQGERRCRHMMRKQIAISASAEVNHGHVIFGVMPPINRAGLRRRQLSINRRYAMTHDRGKNDEPHGKKAKPGDHSITATSGHDGGHRGSDGILTETRNADDTGKTGGATRHLIASLMCVNTRSVGPIRQRNEV
ncbi:MULTISPECIES: hypothetical protein [unclassified Burkholderia]|uniref:hypothetical protein n=2 Tax=Burkholderia TaxID=32008 RepID=UPI001E35B1C2|nr:MULTISPECIES: hypothetical protein [unclassified Burkholderia]